MNAVRRSALAVARGGCDEPAKLRRSPLDIQMVRDCAFGRLGPRQGCRLTIALFHLTTDAPPRTPSPSRRRRPDRTSSPSMTSTSSTLSVSMTTPTILGASSTATRRCHARARRVASVDSFSLGTANRRSTSLKKLTKNFLPSPTGRSAASLLRWRTPRRRPRATTPRTSSPMISISWPPVPSPRRRNPSRFAEDGPRMRTRASRGAARRTSPPKARPFVSLLRTSIFFLQPHFCFWDQHPRTQPEFALPNDTPARAPASPPPTLVPDRRSLSRRAPLSLFPPASCANTASASGA